MKVYFPGLADECRKVLSEILPDILQTAREHGYCVALHGSVARDIDLIAIPWTNEASAAEQVAEAIRLAAEKITGHAFVAPHEIAETPKLKPHGRMCWSFHLGGGPYIDLSVMPRLEKKMTPTKPEALFSAEDFDGKVLDLDYDGDRKFTLCNRDAVCIAEIANAAHDGRCLHKIQWRVVEAENERLKAENTRLREVALRGTDVVGFVRRMGFDEISKTELGQLVAGFLKARAALLEGK